MNTSSEDPTVKEEPRLTRRERKALAKRLAKSIAKEKGLSRDVQKRLQALAFATVSAGPIEDPQSQVPPSTDTE